MTRAMTSNDISWHDCFNSTLQQKFQMTCLGAIQKYIGIEFTNIKEGFYYHQPHLASKFLRDLGMHDNLRLTTDTSTLAIDATMYRSIVRKLNFLTNTRPNIQYSMNQVAWFMQALQEQRFQACKQILGCLRYVK